MGFISFNKNNGSNNSDENIINQKDSVVDTEKSFSEPMLEKENVEVNSHNSLKEISEDLLSKIQEGFAAIEELKGTMEQIAAAAEESAGATEESLSAITEIKQNSKFLEKETQEIANTILKFQELIIIASENIEESSLGLKRTADSAIKIANKSEELYNASINITDAVNLITKLSKKTSLLALNAAIEAARAKERGKSFTVMASEIRAMASKSSNYTQRVKDIVKQIQEEISSTRDGILKIEEEFSQASVEGSNSSEKMKKLVVLFDEFIEKSNNMINTIDKVVDEIGVLHQSAETISAAAEESASSVNEITSTIGVQVKSFSQVEDAAKMLKTLASKSDNNVSISTEIATASEQLSSSVEELRDSMEQTVEALEQIEQAADISKSDAEKEVFIAEKCVEYISISNSLINEIYSNVQEIEKDFEEIFNSLKNIKNKADGNLSLVENRKHALNIVKSKINSLNNTIRKIEIAIVQTAALSINGAVEAIRIGELGEGFSEVSKDIRELAMTSEENLDKVIDIIDDVHEENDMILTELNNIVLTSERESEKLQRIENELIKNHESLKKVKEKISQFVNSIKEMQSALEQSKIAAEQIKEASELSYQNTSQSKEAANIILNIIRDIETKVKQLNRLANQMV